jgi:hypothetical protein
VLKKVDILTHSLSFYPRFSPQASSFGEFNGFKSASVYKMGQSEGQDFAGRVATQAASVSMDRHLLITMLLHLYLFCTAILTLLKDALALSVEKCGLDGGSVVFQLPIHQSAILPYMILFLTLFYSLSLAFSSYNAVRYWFPPGHRLRQEDQGCY